MNQEDRSLLEQAMLATPDDDLRRAISKRLREQDIIDSGGETIECQHCHAVQPWLGSHCQHCYRTMDHEDWEKEEAERLASQQVKDSDL